MMRLIWLRTLGGCVAVPLILYAGLGLYDDITRAKSRAIDLFSGRSQPLERNISSQELEPLLSFDGDVLADDAAAKTAKALRHPAIAVNDRTAENKRAQEAAIKALNVSPIRPELWLALGMLKVQAGEPVTPALKMSYFTGAVPANAALARIETVTSTTAASDEEIRLLARSDVRSALAGRSHFEALLIAAYVRATPDGKSLLLEASQETDPKLNAMLRRH